VEENSYQKRLIYSSHQTAFMDEEIIRIEIHEYDSSVVVGMPKDQKIKWKDIETAFRIHILEEYEPSGAQHLKAEDIIEELNRIPENMRKYVTSVALVPFAHPYKDHFISKEDAEDGWTIIGSGDYYKNQITIYAVPLDRPNIKSVLRNKRTLCHEAGHIIDGDPRAKAKLKIKARFISHTPQWTMAMCQDSKIKRESTELSSYFVSKYAEGMYLLNEDFADSVKYFSDEFCRAWLKQYCPSRYKILEDLLGPI
jgi:hypothetical protein